MKIEKVWAVTIAMAIILIMALSVLHFSDYSFCPVTTDYLDRTKAQNFIRINMPTHKTMYNKLVNQKGKFVAFSPYDYETLYEARDVLDSLKQYCALVPIEEEDERKISGEYLMEHLDISLKTWKNSRFSKHLGFKDFADYLLPYRAGDEIFSDYRQHLLDTFSKVFDSIKTFQSTKRAVKVINGELKKRLSFDLRSHSELHSPSMLEILKKEKGSCASLTQFAAMTIRTQGIPVAIDECPVWGHRNSGHQWNAFLDTNGQWIPFGGAETDPDEFDAINDSVKAPKIFRHTYSVQDDFGPPLANTADIPRIFHKRNRIDVTREYVGTSTVTIVLEDDISVNNNYMYLAVFNAEQWKIVSWAKFENGTARFDHMGDNNIIYLPVFYDKGKTIPASHPFLLTPKGRMVIGSNLSTKRAVRLKYYNKFFDIKWNFGVPKEEWKMELFYWNMEWISCGIHTVKKDRTLHFDQVPQGALYLIKSHDWPNTWQRIFTMKKSIQTWY